MAAAPSIDVWPVGGGDSGGAGLSGVDSLGARVSLLSALRANGHMAKARRSAWRSPNAAFALVNLIWQDEWIRDVKLKNYQPWSLHTTRLPAGCILCALTCASGKSIALCMTKTSWPQLPNGIKSSG